MRWRLPSAHRVVAALTLTAPGRHEHRFRTLSMISVGTYVVGYLVVGVGLALLGAGGIARCG